MRFLFAIILFAGCPKKPDSDEFEYVQPTVDWPEDDDLDDLPESDTGDRR